MMLCAIQKIKKESKHKGRVVCQEGTYNTALGRKSFREEVTFELISG